MLLLSLGLTITLNFYTVLLMDYEIYHYKYENVKNTTINKKRFDLHSGEKCAENTEAMETRQRSHTAIFLACGKPTLFISRLHLKHETIIRTIWPVV